jgi:hypothetical protein
VAATLHFDLCSGMKTSYLAVSIAVLALTVPGNAIVIRVDARESHPAIGQGQQTRVDVTFRPDQLKAIRAFANQILLKVPEPQ